MNTVPNENILKLRELTKKIVKTENDECARIVRKIKTLVNETSMDVIESETDKDKLKHYEKLCLNLITILNTIKIF